MNKKTIFQFKYYCFLIIVLALVFPFQMSAADTTLTHVKLQLKWKHQFQFAGYYAAIEQGYYERAGIKLELIEANEDELPVNSLIEGKAEFGISTSDAILMRSEGYPVVILATIFQHSAQILLATKLSGIEHVHNLVGKKLMLEPHAADLVAYMNDEGISLNQIESIPHSFDVNMLIENKTDAMTAYSTDEPFVLKELNIGYNIITPISGGIDFYGDVLITTELLLQNNPKLVKDFRNASIKGWQYAMDNPKEIIDLIYNKYSKRHSKGHLSFEAQKMQNLIRHDIIEIGYSNVGRWQRIIDIYKQTNMLSADFALDGLLYTDYLKQDIVIPWKLIGIFMLVFMIITALAIFFYRLSKKLKHEVLNGQQMQKSLLESKKELQESNDQLLQLHQFKDDMSNMIIHDLKSPIATIINVRLLTDEEGLNIVEQAGYKMLNLVQNILGVYKNKNAKIDLNYIDIEIPSIFKSALKEVQLLANQKYISINFNPTIECLISVDKNLMIRVFVNLLSNAIKFSDNVGEVNITLKANGQNTIKVTVSNQGQAIPINKQITIFERFAQSEKRDSGKISSTGLGLTFCKMAIEAHGGEIGVNSEPKKDVEFWFTLPNAECKEIELDYVDRINNNDYSILTPSEIEYLSIFIVKLEKLKVFEVTAINKILKSIEKKSNNIENWLSEIIDTVYKGKADEYKKMLEIK